MKCVSTLTMEKCTRHTPRLRMRSRCMYYYEEDSDYILRAPKFGVYRNKYTALKTLLEMYASSTSSHTEKDDKIFNNAKGMFRTYIPAILSLFGPYNAEDRKNVDRFMTGEVIERKGVRYDPTSKGVANNVLMSRMYAHEDVLDESLCEMTRMMNIDVLILTHMVGTNRLVTEVLDTRPRFSMRDNLYEMTS